MDEITARLGSQTARQPLTDAGNRSNTKPPGYEYDSRHESDQDDLKSPDRMSIVTSSISPRVNVDTNCLPPVADTHMPSKRDSTVSTASTVLSGRGRRKTHVGPWQLGRTLGKGATGRVRLAKHAITGQTAAIKIVSKKSAAMVQSESIAAMDRCAGHFGGGTARQMPCGIEREVVIMKLIEHANVISLYDVWENRGELYLVLEHVEGGELFDYVSNHGPLPEEEAVRLFRQIIAGLGFCHRFNICHRDLKPENILLDAWHNVKLADFGMAALQPAGHWLNTSCGSPHYAAPEIIYGKRYRGDRADIWSCGIILYALLTGYLPFDGGDLPNTLRLVKKGEYFIPSELSDESADLIQRILQKRPEDRINMQSIFMHPLLRKYEKLHQAMSKHYVGPPPPLSIQECGNSVTSRQEIDIDILQNLQTLWHDVKPDVLVNRVLCLEPTQERMFYNALIRFRDEQMENYQGQPLEYSASDYHHISLPVRGVSKRTPNGRTQHGSQRRTQFSVKKPTHRRVDSIKEPKSCGTVGSYDPFRSPHNVRIPEPDYAQVTIHRESSGISNKTPAREIERPANPVPSDDYEDDEPPSSPFAVVRNKKAKGTSIKSFHSKTSQVSSRRGIANGNTPYSASYKRNVSFHHIRHRSQGSGSGRPKHAPPKQAGPKRQASQNSLQVPTDVSILSERHDSPGLPAQPTVVRGTGVTVKKCPQIKKVRDSDFIWKDEARQVSHELSKICEEAFNGSSMSTGCTTSVRGGTETPDTSVSLASPENSQHQITAPKLLGRSLPETPCSSAANLAETRRKLIEHAKEDGSDVVPAHISGVVTQLDRLIEEDTTRQCGKEDRDELHFLPDPFVKSAGEPCHLPMISEELNHQYHENQNHVTKDNTEQNTVARSTVGSQASSRTRDGKTTIRMVPESSIRSIAEVKPLNIRKNGRAPSSDEAQPGLGDSPTRHGSLGSDRSSRFASAASRQTRHPSGLDPIEEHPGSPKRNDTKGSKAKWSWFPHRYGSKDNILKLPKEPRPIQPSTATVIVHEVDRPDDVQTEQPSQGTTSRKSSAESHIGGFFRKILKRKPSKSVLTEQPPPPEPELVEIDSPLTPSKTNFPSSLPGNNNSQKPLPRRPRTTGKSQNWFARVFQLKPATRVVALNTSKIRGRKEVFRILREWKQYGLEDVYLDKTNSVVHGRVGEANFLRLKPVEFSAEFYTVLEHGRQANLSLVRFRQERGAASSFGKVVDSLNVVMKQRNLLVEDPARAKKMSRVLVDYAN